MNWYTTHKQPRDLSKNVFVYLWKPCVPKYLRNCTYTINSYLVNLATGSVAYFRYQGNINVNTRHSLSTRLTLIDGHSALSPHLLYQPFISACCLCDKEDDTFNRSCLGAWLAVVFFFFFFCLIAEEDEDTSVRNSHGVVKSWRWTWYILFFDGINEDSMKISVAMIVAVHRHSQRL